MKFCESSFFQVKKKHGRWVRAFSLGKLVSLDCWNEGAVVPGTCSFCEFRMRPVSYKHIFKIGYICNVPVFDAAFLPILKDFAVSFLLFRKHTPLFSLVFLYVFSFYIANKRFFLHPVFSFYFLNKQNAFSFYFLNKQVSCR